MATATEQREFKLRIDALVKSVRASQPPEETIALLEILKNEAAPTEQMLRERDAGRIIRRLCSNANKDIARAAAEIIAKWKKLVKRERAKVKESVTSAPAASGSQSPAIHAAPSSSSSKHKTFVGNPLKRSCEADGVDVKRYAENIRNNVISFVYRGLAYRSTESPEAVLARAVEVEDAGYMVYKEEMKEYAAKMRSLALNLKTNHDIALRVLDGTISANKFVRMTIEELKSERQKEEDDALEKENMKKAQMAKKEPNIAKGRVCGKCKMKDTCSFEQAQTRSADEPMTSFFFCTNCGIAWKARNLIIMQRVTAAGQTK